MPALSNRRFVTRLHDDCPFCGEPRPDTGFVGTSAENAARGWFRVHLEKCPGLSPVPTTLRQALR